MYLKALEIQGFKSFPDKTILNFGSDITAIVGPNGSGKSNISDAISWVMGEQSTKALRGVKMEDVIFGGTLKRPQVGFAEASLILDNSEGLFSVETSEVMVTRRYYRSGESEYYINRQSARLKDIHELFMDTGLGREGYSNIGQGKIDEILSVKSTDRREVFEEAAGISKFRHRKEETERRLANTEENLVRIGDKISELELQITPLKQQAEQAQKYLRFRQELKGLEVTVWLDTLDKLAQASKKAEEDFRSAEFILEQSREEVTGLYQKLENLSQELRQEDQRSEDARSQISDLDAQLQKKDSEISISNAAIANYEQTIVRVSQELTEQGSRSSGILDQIARRNDRILELKQRLDAISQELGQQAERADSISQEAGQLDQTLLSLHAKQAELSSESARTAAALSATSINLEDYEARKASLLCDEAEAKKRHQDAMGQQLECQQALLQAKEQVTAAQNRIAGYALRCEARVKKRDSLSQKRSELEIEKKTLSSKLGILREMDRDYEGFSKAVKQVMLEAERGGLKNIIGPVSKSISVHDEYAVAIEIALGSAMQQMIVRTEEDAKAAIGYLKRRNLGRATFLPLSSIRGRTLQEQGLAKRPGFIGVASDLVDYDPSLKDVVENLLGRTVIVETLEFAVAMAKGYSNRFRIVTLDGQVVNPGGSMTGGSVSREAGILSRANEMKKLSEMLKTLNESERTLEAELQEAARSAAEVEFQLTTVRGELRQAEDEVLRFEGNEKQADLLVAAAAEKIHAAQDALQALENRSNDDLKRSQELKQAAAHFEQELAQLQASIDAMHTGQSGLQEKASQVSAAITELRMEMASCEAERTTALQNVAQLQQLQQDMQGDYSQKQQTIAQYEAQIEQTREKIEALQSEKAALGETLQAGRQTLQSILSRRQEIEAQKTQTDREIQEKNKNLMLMERECARLEQKKVTSGMEEKQILDRLWDSYELTRTTAADYKVELESLAAANRQIADLRRKISALGTPNLGAIDEYARVHERYEYLSCQRDDVLHARKELEQIVSSITTEMTDIFVREFGKINDYFSKTFTEMFGGGRASLELEDIDQPLSCGIEIKVQPPGKQVKTITLLSGGEKAFVAIALYFAILKVRPTPFCMLDEIDAALDDRNVERFAKYLRNLCGKTQFIVITHRRGTMEASDTLYGVTMQEEGVSKILHVDLNQVERQLGLVK